MSAAATDVLLDAIARSDGTREGVARALKHTSLPDSVVGPLELDANGEPVKHPVTYVRTVRGGARQDILLQLGYSKVVGVIDPPRRLIDAPHG